MATILIKNAVPKSKRKGELLFVSKSGDSIQKITKKKTVARVTTIPKIRKEDGKIYFVDGNGNVASAPMKNWGKKKKAKPKAKKAGSKSSPAKRKTTSKARKKSTSAKRRKKK